MMNKPIIYKNVDISSLDKKYRTLFRRIFYKLDETTAKTLLINLNVNDISDLNFFNRLIEILKTEYYETFKIHIDSNSMWNNCSDVSNIFLDPSDNEQKIKLIYDTNNKNIIQYPILNEMSFSILNKYMYDIFYLFEKKIHIYVYFVGGRDNPRLSCDKIFNFNENCSKIFIQFKK